MSLDAADGHASSAPPGKCANARFVGPAHGRLNCWTGEREGLTVRRNLGGFLFYALGYSLLMQPVCVWGYVAELLGLRKKWDTK